MNSSRAWSVLITRPTNSARALAELLKKQAIDSLYLPCLATYLPPKPSLINQSRNYLLGFDLAIFCSKTAVRAVFKQRPNKYLRQQLICIGIGPSTCQALKALGFKQIHSTQFAPYNSEALLKLKILEEIKQKKIIVFKAWLGRSHLEEQLALAGASVRVVAAYQSKIPLASKKTIPVLDLSKLQMLVFTSSQALEAFYTHSKRPKALLQKLILVVGKRNLAYAKHLGFKNCVCADSADNPCILAAILALRNHQEKIYESA